MRLMASEIAEATEGHLQGPNVAILGVSMDSRTTSPQELFVALVHKRDGYQFIPDALRAGATAYMASRSVTKLDADTISLAEAAATAIIVPDTNIALAKLGTHVRKQLVCPVVGITGSVGKTSVKDMTAAATSMQYLTHSSPQSFNNELGVPLTLANCPNTTEVLVVEMGARGKGHIAKLCEQARPTVGVVTAVGAAHLEMFGSIEAVAAAKSEMVECLDQDGVAVLNADQPLVAAMSSRTKAQVLTFGRSNGDVQADKVQLNEMLQPRFWLNTPSGGAEVTLPVCGEHMVDNALAAAAAALAVGVDISAIAAGLANARLSPWRMEVNALTSGAVLINDAYNANPVSMRAALLSLAQIKRRRLVAVLGAMAELGESSVAEHAAIAAQAQKLGIEIIAVGTADYGVDPVPNARAVSEVLGELGDDMAVLVKGSRVLSLEQVASELGGL